MGPEGFEPLPKRILMQFRMGTIFIDYYLSAFYRPSSPIPFCFIVCLA
jgi:hypothetical protein